jgi:hypothetical protein
VGERSRGRVSINERYNYIDVSPHGRNGAEKFGRKKSFEVGLLPARLGLLAAAELRDLASTIEF